MSYTWLVEIAWSLKAVTHIWERHQVRPAEANEAVNDIDAIWYEPDPASKSGLTDRVVGYSPTREQVLCVVVLKVEGDYQGINAWPANASYRRRYNKGTP